MAGRQTLAPQVVRRQAQHAAQQEAAQLFGRIFRINRQAMEHNQALWAEHEQLQQTVRTLHARQGPPGLFRRWSLSNDEKLLKMVSSQIALNDKVIEWCQEQLQAHLHLSHQAQRQLQTLIRNQNSDWNSFIREHLHTVVKIGGVSAILFCADQFFNKKRAWNAVTRLLGQRWISPELQKSLGKMRIYKMLQTLGGWGGRVSRAFKTACRAVGLCGGGGVGASPVAYTTADWKQLYAVVPEQDQAQAQVPPPQPFLVRVEHPAGAYA